MSEEALQIAEERKEAKGKEERESYTQLNTEFQRIARRNEEDVFLEFPCFLHDPMNADNLISGSSASSKPCLYMWKFFNSCERELPDVQAGFLSSICNYLAGQIVFHWAISVLFIKCT